MTRDQLEHAIRAACDVASDTEVIVFGSQAILGNYPDVPESLWTTLAVDRGCPMTLELTTVEMAKKSCLNDEIQRQINKGRKG